MTLDSRYVVTSDVDTYFVDKDSGQPLANGTLKFYKDSQRTIPKPVYQLTGAPPVYSYASLGSSITLSNAGTVQNAGGDNVVIYYYPYTVDPLSGKDVLDLYYIECRDQNGNIQFTREAWPNLSDGSGDTQDLTAPLQNQISNPQFTNVFFGDGLTYTITLSLDNDKEIPISPDWMIIASGTGSIQVSRNIISGSNQFRTNPPYSLKITNGVGVNNVKLVQRFRKNSGLWTSTTDSDIYLSGSFLAKNEIGGTQTIGIYYRESTPGYTPILVSSGSFDSVYTYIEGGTSSAIPSSSDPDLGDDGYIDIFLNIPDNSSISLTSINLIPSFKKNIKPPYSLDSSNRNESYQGDWYIPNLSQKTTDSFLVGWDFALNPRQYVPQNPYNLNIPPSNLKQYISDQTIAFSSNAAGNLFTYGFNSLSSGLAVRAGPATNNLSFCISQYLSGSEVLTMMQTPLSVNFFGYSLGSNDVTMRVYLYSSTSPTYSIPTLTGFIGSLSGNGTFTLTDPGWSRIPNVFDEGEIKAKLQKNPSDENSEKNNIGFNGWNPVNPLHNLFCIVVTFSGFTVGDTVSIHSVSLVPGKIPYQGNKKKYNEVLLQCRRYYISSASYGYQLVGDSTLGPAPSVTFPTTMRTSPSVSIDVKNMRTSSLWAAPVITPSTSPTQYGFTSQGTSPAGSVNFDPTEISYTADARLGVVP